MGKPGGAPTVRGATVPAGAPVNANARAPNGLVCLQLSRGPHLFTMSSNREFVIEVIELYKEHTCLWKVSDPNYHDKNKRNLALGELVTLFKTRDESATKEVVLKKLTSMRSSFRKEINKVKASERSGTSSADVHVPKLWYYDLLLFLEDQETPRPSKNAASLLDEMPFGMDDEEEIEAESGDTESVTSGQGSSSTSTIAKTGSASFKRPRSKADQILEKISKRIDQPTPNTCSAGNKREKHDAFGEYVAEKLRSLPTEMACFCQKIINDAIFFGETNMLSVDSRIVNSPVAGNHTITPLISQETLATPPQNPIMSAYLDAVNSLNSSFN